MSKNTIRCWMVPVTMDVTISAMLPVPKSVAASEKEAVEVALQPGFLLDKGGRFRVDSDNWDRYVEDEAYTCVEDPEAEIEEHDVQPDRIQMSNYKSSLLKVAGAAYSEDGVNLEADPLPGDRADGLAEFLSNELKDVVVGESDENAKSAMVDAIDSAIRQLQDVAEAIENA